MLYFTEFCQADLEDVIAISTRKHMHLHEYSFLKDENLFGKFKLKLQSNLVKTDAIAFTVKTDQQVVGYIECQEDVFDSEYLGLRCFRITELILLNDDHSKVSMNAKFALKSLKNRLQGEFGNGYLFSSLSNNCPNLLEIFNSYTDCGLNYIHTLLTFSQLSMQDRKNDISTTLSSEEIIIREAKKEDLPYLEQMALTSFKFSRFHMDPLLDDEKASELLKVSVRNSLIDGFADVIFVAEYKNIPVGYYSGKKRFDNVLKITMGEAMISAVSQDIRGKGVFKLLNAAMLNWFSEHTDVAEMGTYLINAPVHRTWIGNNLPLVRGTHQFSQIF